jgi:hypothetical protein
MAVLADLLVRFGADSAELRKTLKTVQSDLSAFTKNVAGLKNTLSGAFVAVGAERLVSALADMVVEGTEAADRMGKLAQQSGIAVEDLSRLSYAAELNGSSTEGLATALKLLSKEMEGAAAGSKSSVALFRAIGVSVTDSTGALRPMGAVLADVADRFASWQDGAGKAAIAQQLFGKSGAELIPFLNQGSAGLKSLGDEAERLGLVIDSETATSADELGDNFDRLRMLGQSFSVHLSSELNPALKALTDQFIETSAQAGGMESAAQVVAGGFKLIASSAAVAWFAVQIATNHTTGALDQWDAMVARMRAIWTEAEQGANAFNSADLRSHGRTTTAPTAPPIIKATEDGAKAAEKALQSLIRARDDLRQQVETAGMDDVAIMQYRLTIGDLADEMAAAGENAPYYAAGLLDYVAALKKIKEQAAATEVEMDRLVAMVDESRQIFDATRTPTEKYAATVKHLGELLAAGAITQDEYNRAVRQARKDFADSESSAQDLADAGVAAFDAVVQAALDGGDAIEAFWKSLLSSFTAMIRKMLEEWLKAKGIATIGDAIGSIGSSVGGGGSYMPDAAPGSGGAKLDPVGGGADASGKQVNLYVSTLDASSFDAFLARNEGVLASRINRIAYKGRT